MASLVAARAVVPTSMSLASPSSVRSNVALSRPRRLLDSRAFAVGFPCQLRKSVKKCMPAQCAVLGKDLSGVTFDVDAARLWLSEEIDRVSSVDKKLGDGLILTRGTWDWQVASDTHHHFSGRMVYHNMTKGNELFVPELKAKVTILSEGNLDGITSTVKIIPRHVHSYKPRTDGYWPAFILQGRETTEMELLVDIKASHGANLRGLKAAWVRVVYWVYGPHGRTKWSQDVVLPLKYDPPLTQAAADAKWIKVTDSIQTLAIPTHLLCHQDDPLRVMKQYVMHLAQPGDVLAIGETPLAIMQGRNRHPSTVKPTPLARFACLFFKPVSSLATACGMQTVIDLVGQLRVFIALVGGIIAKVLGVPGMFYVLAGKQAKLIDDVTGTLPPYDQFITLGPMRDQETVDNLRAKTGIDVAVVDVNDLKKVDILAASAGVRPKDLVTALRGNPAGNSDEQTPLVLIRGAASPA
eukprot:jgi/Mesvir1/12194/Mv00429-RA.1